MSRKELHAPMHKPTNTTSALWNHCRHGCACIFQKVYEIGNRHSKLKLAVPKHVLPCQSLAPYGLAQGQSGRTQGSSRTVKAIAVSRCPGLSHGSLIDQRQHRTHNTQVTF